MRCVYLLCGDRRYTGSTNDLKRRLKEHRIKGYSAKRIGNRVCKGYILCENRLEARRLERKIKKGCHPERCVSWDSFIPYEGS